jgi:hypothetical protein
MIFKDEFEYDVDGITYSVEVEGVLTELETILNKVTIEDNYEAIDSDHKDYHEIYDYAQNREYEVEEHHTDFGYYNHDVDNFLREKDEF